MAVAYDGEAIVQQVFSGAGPWTWAGKTTAGSNRVGVFRFGASVFSLIDTLTWGGVAMTFAINQGTTDRKAVIAYIVNPPTAASDVVMTGLAPINGYGGVVSYNGVDTADPIRASNGANGTTGTPATVTVSSAVDDLVVDSMIYEGTGTPPAADGSQTQRYGGDQGSWFSHGSDKAGASSVVMEWTVVTPTDWAVVAVSLRAASVGGPPSPSRIIIAPPGFA